MRRDKNKGWKVGNTKEGGKMPSLFISTVPRSFWQESAMCRGKNSVGRPFSRSEMFFSCLGLLLSFKAHSCDLFCDILPTPSRQLHCNPTALCKGLPVGSSCQRGVHSSHKSEKLGLCFFAVLKMFIFFLPYILSWNFQTYKYRNLGGKV